MGSDKKPVFGTKEWASSNFNFMLGCQHQCTYCFACSNAMRYKKIASPADWATPVVSLKAVTKTHGKKQGTIMFPTAHDIHPDNLANVLTVMEALLKPGNHLLVVSKPHIECIQEICKKLDQYKDQVLFRFSIGSRHNETLQLWEPNAPSYEKRYDCLQHAYAEGWNTSVSCEPLLASGIDEVMAMVAEFKPYVTDAIWLGKGNFFNQRLTMNGRTDLLDSAKALEDVWSDDAVKHLYDLLGMDPKVKWKESMKKVLGIDVPTEKGLDI
jgi:DNA repair photolyase